MGAGGKRQAQQKQLELIGRRLRTLQHVDENAVAQLQLAGDETVT